MKIKYFILVISLFLMFFVGCSITQNEITGTQDLILTQEDIQQIGMMEDGCKTNSYETGEFSSLAQYSICNYTITKDNTEVIIELSKYTNLNDLNGSYQYNSLHLRSSEGLINENKYGDLSRFSVNNENDYGGQLNQEGIYYYHLWIVKNLYLIHITSKGSEEAKQQIEDIGEKILNKF